MLDLKKELLKFQPARLADDDLKNGIISGEITDLSEILKLIISNSGQGGSNSSRRS